MLISVKADLRTYIIIFIIIIIIYCIWGVTRWHYYKQNK